MLAETSGRCHNVCPQFFKAIPAQIADHRIRVSLNYSLSSDLLFLIVGFERFFRFFCRFGSIQDVLIVAA
jgi:hypothetical protein